MMPHHVEHEDIYKRVVKVENDIVEVVGDVRVQLENYMLNLLIKALVVIVGSMTPFVLWAWNVHVAQQAFNAEIDQRVAGNQERYAEARDTQHKIESKLEDIYRFIREDSKELRQEIRSWHGKEK